MNIFLFGNGISRKDFDISSLVGKGLIVGCNWAYKDYPFDVICSADREVSAKIAKEWKGDWLRRDDYSSRNNNRDNVYWNKHTNLICKLPQLGHTMGWNTGRAAIYALDKKFKPSIIYLLGFDLDRTSMHAESTGDNPETDARGLFINGWNSLLTRKDMCPVTRVGPVDYFTDELTCKHMTYEEFNNELSRTGI